MIWIHPSWIFLQRHQEDVLLFVGGVESEDAHHDEVCEGGGAKEHQPITHSPTGTVSNSADSIKP